MQHPHRTRQLTVLHELEHAGHGVGSLVSVSLLAATISAGSDGLPSTGSIALPIRYELSTLPGAPHREARVYHAR